MVKKRCPNCLTYFLVKNYESKIQKCCSVACFRESCFCLRKCEICPTVFKCSKKSKRRTCGMKCGKQIRRIRRVILLDKKGYYSVYVPKHPSKPINGYVYLHRLIMEQIVGRILKRKEIVHHINRNKLDNRPENLQLFKDHIEHSLEHGRTNYFYK